MYFAISQDKPCFGLDRSCAGLAAPGGEHAPARHCGSTPDPLTLGFVAGLYLIPVVAAICWPAAKALRADPQHPACGLTHVISLDRLPIDDDCEWRLRRSERSLLFGRGKIVEEATEIFSEQVDPSFV
jgi:hypothetical protein